MGSYLGNLYRSWNDSLDNFTYERLPGEMDARDVARALRQRFSALEECDVYVAGPSVWIEKLRTAFAAEAVSTDRMQFHVVDFA